MIHIKNLNYKYPYQSENVLEDIHLDIHNGDYFVITGNNGSGKTTLIQIILGFLQTNSDYLDIEVNQFGYVPQMAEFINSSFPITVDEMLTSYLHILHSSSSIDNYLEKMGLTKQRYQMIHELSGGQLQKVLLIRALLCKPDCLILDEPSTGIDHQSQVEIYNYLKELNRKQNMTIISIEHDPARILSTATRIYVMDNKQGKEYSIDEFKEYIK